MGSKWWPVALLLLASILPACQTYLVAEDSPMFLSGPEGSYFGYSLSFHSNAASNFVLVGSPKGSSDAAVAGVSQPGVLYKCPTTPGGGGQCAEVEVDTNGNRWFSNDTRAEDKSNMWLGSAVMSAGPDQEVLVCARDYKQIWYWPNRVAVGQTDAIPDTVGRCYLLPGGLDDDADDIQVVQACHVFSHSIGPGAYWRSQCGVGDRIDVLNTTKATEARTGNDTEDAVSSFQFAVGGPSQLIGRGQVFLIDYNTSNPNSSATVRTTGFPHTRNFIDSYFGFALAQGDIDGDGVAELAASRPRASVGGSVWIMSAENEEYSSYFSTHFQAKNLLVEITTDEVGEYFGYSLAMADLAGNGQSDLVVGAPLHGGLTNGKHSNTVYDTGRVYVFAATNLSQALELRRSSLSSVQLGTADASTVLRGQPHSWFGAAVTSMGDMDGDGYEDVAVGAPFEQVSATHSGAVYLYFGSPDGIQSSPGQRITGDSIKSSMPLRGFGFSFSRKWDTDRNHFNDLAVGAPFKSSVAVLRSRPTIVVTMSILVLDSLENGLSFCNAGGIHNAICTTVAICASYTTRGEDIDAGLLEIHYTAEINGSMQFPGPTATSLSSFVGGALLPTSSFPERKCANHKVVLPSLGQACQRSAIHLLDWQLIDKPNTAAVLTPVLLQHSFSLPDPAIVRISPPCLGCEPNLVLRSLQLQPGSGNSPIVLGREGHLLLEFEVANVWNDRTAAACNPQFKLNLPKGLTFRRVVQGKVLSCSTDVNAGIATCQMQQLSLPGALDIYRLELSVGRKLAASRERFLNIHVLVESKNDDQDLEDNLQELRALVSLEASVALSGNSHQRQVEISKKRKPASEQNAKYSSSGPFVDHSFVIFNQGPSPIPGSRIELKWPLKLENGSPLLFLIAFRTNIDNLSCNYTSLLQVNGLTSAGIDGVVRDVIDLEVTDGNIVTRPACHYLNALCYINVHCNVPPMDAGTAGILQATWRVSTNLSVEERKMLPLKIDTTVELLEVEKAMDFRHVPTDRHMAKVVTVIYEIYLKPRGQLNWWIILIAVAVGFFLILVCMTILYKCGFFKRKKLDKAARQKVARASIQ